MYINPKEMTTTESVVNEPREISNRHWTVGGTFVTNFSLDQREIYEEAIKRHADPLLVIEERPCPPCPQEYGHALHWRNNDVKWDLSPFWRVFDAVRAERKSKDDPR